MPEAKSIRVITARTAQPNTPESDKMKFVEHIVEIVFSDGTEQTIHLPTACDRASEEDL